MDTVKDRYEKGVPITPQNKAYFDYGINTVFQSIDVIKDYIKLMIPLTTGLITIYFALLKFIGIDSSNTMYDGNLLMIPPILMLVALTIFIVTIFPLRLRITLGNIESIKLYRNKSTSYKYYGALIGSVFFLLAILVMIILLI